jgi:hypothetical protein
MRVLRGEFTWNSWQDWNKPLYNFPMKFHTSEKMIKQFNGVKYPVEYFVQVHKEIVAVNGKQETRVWFIKENRDKVLAYSGLYFEANQNQPDPNKRTGWLSPHYQYSLSFDFPQITHLREYYQSFRKSVYINPTLYPIKTYVAVGDKIVGSCAQEQKIVMNTKNRVFTDDLYIIAELPTTVVFDAEKEEDRRVYELKQYETLRIGKKADLPEEEKGKPVLMLYNIVLNTFHTSANLDKGAVDRLILVDEPETVITYNNLGKAITVNKTQTNKNVILI